MRCLTRTEDWLEDSAGFLASFICDLYLFADYPLIDKYIDPLKVLEKPDNVEADFTVSMEDGRVHSFR